MLHDNRSRPDTAASHEITDAHFNYVNSAKFAVDREVKQGPIAKPPLMIEPEADGPHLLWLQGPLRTYDPSSVPRPTFAGCRIMF